MQSSFTVDILVLQTEGLVCAIRYLEFLFKTPPGGLFAVPQQIAVLIGHLSRDADFVAVEVVGLLAAFTVFGCPIADLGQEGVAVGIGVDIGISAVPNESGFLFEVVWKTKTACVPHTPYVRIESFVRATACYKD